MRQDVTNISVWARPASAMEEVTALELLALQPEQPGVEEEEGATLPAGTLLRIDGDTLVAVVEDGQAIAAAASDETAPQLTELDLSSLLSVEEPEEDVLQKALLQANTVVREDATTEQPQSQPKVQPEVEDPQQQQQQQQTVVIDISSPIELCQNALIVVNGQRCVLQQDSSTGQVLAYPIREPKRKRGRPRKVVPPPTEEAPPAASAEEASVTEPAAVEEDEEEDDGDKGMVEIFTEDGALVRRSRRRRKVARTMKDYHLSEGSESEQDTEPDPEPRRRGRPPKNYHEEDPFWRRSNVRRRPRLRKREGTARSNPMQAFLVQMADGQTLVMQIPAASIPEGMDLHQVAQNIANSLNAAAAQQAVSEGVLTAEESSHISRPGGTAKCRLRRATTAATTTTSTASTSSKTPTRATSKEAADTTTTSASSRNDRRESGNSHHSLSNRCSVRFLQQTLQPTHQQVFPQRLQKTVWWMF
nr:uncharacterized protein LOC119163984 [Rhipicephalus microplus]